MSVSDIPQHETKSSDCSTIFRKDLVNRVFKSFGDSGLVSMVSDYTDSSPYDFESLQQIIDIVNPDDAHTTIFRRAFSQFNSSKEYDELRVMQLVVDKDTSVALYCIPSSDNEELKKRFHTVNGQYSLFFTGGFNCNYEPENVIALIIKMIEIHKEKGLALPTALQNVMGGRFQGNKPNIVALFNSLQNCNVVDELKMYVESGMYESKIDKLIEYDYNESTYHAPNSYQFSCKKCLDTLGKITDT